MAYFNFFSWALFQARVIHFSVRPIFYQLLQNIYFLLYVIFLQQKKYHEHKQAMIFLLILSFDLPDYMF
jgi:hypothetical protein